MAHIRKPLAWAITLNSGVVLLEVAGGVRGNSLSLLMDSVHNLSDELALVCLFCAYQFTLRMNRELQRVANILNSVGLAVVGTLVLWQAAERLLHPQPVVGWLPIVVGLLGAVGNWAVARTLRPWVGGSAAIRLAYVHNLGDTYVSLAPVAAGFLVTILGIPVFDALVAMLVGVWVVTTTAAELRRSADVLLWPEEAVCPHGEGRIA